MTTKHTNNDDRSNALNPNNPAHAAALANQANQLNPDHVAHASSRGKTEGGDQGKKK